VCITRCRNVRIASNAITHRMADTPVSFTHTARAAATPPTRKPAARRKIQRRQDERSDKDLKHGDPAVHQHHRIERSESGSGQRHASSSRQPVREQYKRRITAVPAIALGSRQAYGLSTKDAYRQGNQ
jgi:hypothetical protein